MRLRLTVITVIHLILVHFIHLPGAVIPLHTLLDLDLYIAQDVFNLCRRRTWAELR